jgi:uncharacterized phage infection (PIP) family protein YhgE
MTRNGIAPTLLSNSAALSQTLLAAETTGKLPAEAWPALRSFLLQLAEAQAAGDVQRVAAQIEAAIGPRQALAQAQQALTDGYTSVTQSASDPAQLAEAAAALAALADDVAGRAQQLATLLQS